MIQSPKLQAIALATTVLLANVQSAAACACCTDPGHRVERSGQKLEAFESEELNGLKVAGAAKLRTTAAFPEGIKGFKPIEDDAYKIALTRDAGNWRITLTDSKGGTGSLSFKMPKTADRFEVDFPNEANSVDTSGGASSLIKEWRIAAPVRGDGIFKKGLSNKARVRLILQGRGNACATTFQAYQIVVSGPRENFTFTGKVQD